jgi:hypothetical protein
MEGGRMTSTQTKRVGEVQEESTQDETLFGFAGDARVRVGVKRTINLGDYNSLTVDCSVELPCDPAEIEPAQNAARKLAWDKLNETVSKIRKQ